MLTTRTSSVPVVVRVLLILLVLLALLLLLALLVAKWLRPRRVQTLQKLLAADLVLILLTFTFLTDWPINLSPSSVFWQNHSLFAGAFVSVCLVGSGYLFIDSRLERARQKRDDACLAEIKSMMEVGHFRFWLVGIDLSPDSQRRRSMLQDLRYNREYALALHRTLGVITQLAIGLLTEQGMAVTPKAVHTFRKVDDFVLKQSQAIDALEAEDEFRHSPESTRRANAALLDLQTAHTDALNSYLDLVNAADGESVISEAENQANIR